MIMTFHKLLSPKYFYQISGKLIPYLWCLFGIFLSYGLIDGLFVAPADYQQGNAFRIIYVHVPCAVLSLCIYVIMGISAALFLIWRIKLTDMIAKVSAPLGAWFTFLALVTGSLWGKPMWGTWWIWDARLTSELILLFIYLGIITLRSAIVDCAKASRAVSILILVGIIDIPIIHYSVYWWNTLHQGATLLKFSRPSIDLAMLYPLLAMIISFFIYYAVMMLMRVRQEILQESSWQFELR